MKKYLILLSIFSLLILTTLNSKAATKKIKIPSYLPNTTFSYSVWIPYWARWGGTDEILGLMTENGMKYNSNFTSTSLNAGFYSATDTKMNLDKVDIISPFTFEVNETGAFLDKGKMSEDTFASLIAIAKSKNKKIYPTVLWANAEEMRSVLADKDLQGAILSDITYHLNKYNLDGIDIDFEGKKAESKNDFSALLKLVSTSLHKSNKGLICTIEVRTPLESVYEKLTTKTKQNIERSNDYAVIGKYCDQVRLMAYDQMGVDMKLNNKNKDIMYRPVADINWVEGVIKNTIKDGIPASKIVLGVATYGYKFEVTKLDTLNSTTSTSTKNPNTPDKYGSILLNNKSTYKYSRIGSMNYIFADELAKSLGITPTRNSGGELEFSYTSSTDISNPGVSKTYYVEYSDSVAIKQKIDLAKKYKLAGISIFKIDGNNDHNIWNVLNK